MAQPYRIVDLQGLFSPLTGQEIMEVSLNGAGSCQVPIGQLAYSRTPNTVASGGTFLLAAAANPYGDILVTTTAAVTVQLTLAAARLGVPVSIAAVQITTPNVTILPSSPETIMGLSSFTITNAYGGITLWPVTGIGWYQK